MSVAAATVAPPLRRARTAVAACVFLDAGAYATSCRACGGEGPAGPERHVPP